jgi:hypothetical protein
MILEVRAPKILIKMLYKTVPAKTRMNQKCFTYVCIDKASPMHRIAAPGIR